MEKAHRDLLERSGQTWLRSSSSPPTAGELGYRRGKEQAQHPDTGLVARVMAWPSNDCALLDKLPEIIAP